MMVDFASQEMFEFLKGCVNSDINLICVGAEDSGKTTLLNAISSGVDIVAGNSDSGFRELYEAVNSDKRVFAEYHACSEIDAVLRFALALTNNSLSVIDAMKFVVSKFPIIVIVGEFADGKRRVLRISELVDITEDEHVKVNELFKFKMTGKVKRNESSGVVEEVFGDFQRVNNLKGGILSA